MEQTLEKKWFQKAMESRGKMKEPGLGNIEHIRCKQRFDSYTNCYTDMLNRREGSASRWRSNAEQARLALAQRGELENPFDKARWETMVAVYTECADELERSS